MKLVGAGAQQVAHYLYKADLTLTGSAQPVLACSLARSYLLLQNTGINPMYLEVGAGAAHATISGGKVTGVTIDNAGFNYTKPPLVRLMGGGYAGNTSYLGLNQPLGNAPTNVATALASLSGGAISAITVNNGGSLYAVAPYVQIINSDLDPYGCAVPAIGTGIQLSAGQQMIWNGTFCPTEAVSVIGTSGDKLICRWSE
jgi:hypothetical protein